VVPLGWQPVVLPHKLMLAVGLQGSDHGLEPPTGLFSSTSSRAQLLSSRVWPMQL